MSTAGRCTTRPSADDASGRADVRFVQGSPGCACRSPFAAPGSTAANRREVHRLRFRPLTRGPRPTTRQRPPPRSSVGGRRPDLRRWSSTTDSQARRRGVRRRSCLDGADRPQSAPPEPLTRRQRAPPGFSRERPLGLRPLQGLRQVYPLCPGRSNAQREGFTFHPVASGGAPACQRADLRLRRLATADQPLERCAPHLQLGLRGKRPPGATGDRPGRVGQDHRDASARHRLDPPAAEP